MIIEHEWDQDTCVHCGTPKAMHEANSQNCVPRWSGPARRRDSLPGRRVYAVDDKETIHARMVELEADRLAIRNMPVEPD